MVRKLFFAALLSATAAFGADAPASEASIRELLTVTESRVMIDAMPSQVEGMMRNTMAQILRGEAMTPEQQKIVDGVTAKMVTAVKDELSWEKLEPVYIQIYQKSFTQEEVDGIIAIYKTPFGAALAKKMPVVTQNSMLAMQARMGPMMQRVQVAVKEAAAELQATKKPAP